MLKKQRVTKVVGDLSDALDFARAMLRSGETEAARLHMCAALNNADVDIARAASDPDDYPPEYKAQFAAVVEVLERWAVGGGLWRASRDDRQLEVRGMRGWLATLTLTEDGLTLDSWCPEVGPISHGGGSVPADESPETTARALLQAAKVPAPRP